MAQSKVAQNDLRKALLSGGTLREIPTGRRTTSKEESQALAIAARREELRKSPKSPKSPQVAKLLTA